MGREVREETEGVGRSGEETSAQRGGDGREERGGDRRRGDGRRQEERGGEEMRAVDLFIQRGLPYQQQKFASCITPHPLKPREGNV